MVNASHRIAVIGCGGGGKQEISRTFCEKIAARPTTNLKEFKMENEIQTTSAFFTQKDKQNRQQYQIPYVQWISDIGKDPYLLQNKSAKSAILTEKARINKLPKYVIAIRHGDVESNSPAALEELPTSTSKYSLTKTRWGDSKVAKLDIDGYLFRVYMDIQLISLADIMVALEQKTQNKDIAMEIANITRTQNFQNEVLHHLSKHNMPPMIETDQGIVVSKYLGLEIISNFNKDFRDKWVDQFFDGEYIENRAKGILLHNKLLDRIGMLRMEALNKWIKNGMEWESVREARADAVFVNRRAEMLTRLLAVNGAGRKFRDELDMLGKWYKIDEQLTNNLIKMFQ